MFDAAPEAASDSEFLAIVAHELKGPLTNIGGYTQLLLRQPQLPDERRTNYLRVILDETRRLSRLVNDLVDATQFESGHIETILGPARLDGIIAGALDRAQRVVPEGRLEVDEYAVPEAVWDSARIEDALFHLIVNAWRHAPAAEPVRLTVGQTGDRVLIAVQDRGAGVPEHVETIMRTPFFRVPRSAGGRKVKGLGLFLTRSIAAAHGGALHLRSRPGGGTIAELELPLRAR
ncbi:MAG: HAMP domain-containing histidine kinase [Pirellulales bacterium]|nr:HAMP domain-containing histidine kinase [Pirellulales bacterium]